MMFFFSLFSILKTVLDVLSVSLLCLDLSSGFLVLIVSFFIFCFSSGLSSFLFFLSLDPAVFSLF